MSISRKSVSSIEDHQKVLPIICKCIYSEKKSKPDFGIKSYEQNISSIPTCNSTTKGQSTSNDTCNSQVGLPNYVEEKLQSLLQVVTQSGSWLDDQVIKTSMDILKNQYPMFRGFHNTLFGANLSFHVRVRNNHWIIVEAVTMNFVWVYDSLYDSTDISA